MSDVPHAPEPLERVRAFVNTLEVDTGADRIGSASALGAWLHDHGLSPTRPRPSAAELASAHRLRAALREVLLAHNEERAPDPDAWTAFDRVAREAELQTRWQDEGPALESTRSGARGALGGLLVIVAEAMRDGSWSRLKACQMETCLWAYYDQSRNRSRAWCSMKVCGNRAKVRAYRARRRS